VIERTLTDYYRCPPGFAEVSLAGALSTEPGYFGFGGSICYGRTASGAPAAAPVGVQDTLPAVRTTGGRVELPFDATEVVENLRRERYAVNGAQPRRETIWQRPYYSLRRFLPAPVRRALQRAYLRDWRTVRFPSWPIDDTVDAIHERLLALCLRSRGVDRVPFVWFWPDGAPSCAVLTHDVETTDGRDRCAWLMDADDTVGIKSSFQLVPEGRYELAPAFLETLRRRGFEINVHDLNHDGRLFSSREEFERRAQRINEHVRRLGARGFRSGSLYRHADWYDALAVAYDMSIPNAGHLEIQRGGCCTVMPYMIGNIVELPLTTTQDYTLFHILADFSTDVWKTQMESVISRHGLVSVIVHPDYVTDERTRRAYLVLLDQLAGFRDAGRCWVTLPGEVERWWRARSRMRLVPEGGGWRIEGEGSERARIAYAELDGEGLAYRLEPATVVQPGS
jgi:hypothetical protein